MRFTIKTKLALAFTPLTLLSCVIALDPNMSGPDAEDAYLMASA